MYSHNSILKCPPECECRYKPTDTEQVVADIIEYGNFNEYGGELGEGDWIASYTTAPPD